MFFELQRVSLSERFSGTYGPTGYGDYRFLGKLRGWSSVVVDTGRLAPADRKSLFRGSDTTTQRRSRNADIFSGGWVQHGCEYRKGDGPTPRVVVESGV
jgi:hypothetical protein